MFSYERPLASCVLVAVVAVTSRARAQSPEVGLGREAYESAKFDEAIAHFTRALQDPASSRGDVLEAHRYLLTLSAAANDAASANAHATAALALQPDVAPPAGAPPSAATILARNRASRQGRSARITLAIDRSASRARLEPVDVPAELEAEVRLRCSSDGASVTGGHATTGGALVVSLGALPPASDITCEGTLTTTSGAVLARTATRSPAALSPIKATSATGSGGHEGRIGLYVGVGAAVLGVAAVVTAIIVVAARPAPDHAVLGAPEFSQ